MPPDAKTKARYWSESGNMQIPEVVGVTLEEFEKLAEKKDRHQSEIQDTKFGPAYAVLVPSTVLPKKARPIGATRVRSNEG